MPLGGAFTWWSTSGGTTVEGPPCGVVAVGFSSFLEGVLHALLPYILEESWLWLEVVLTTTTSGGLVTAGC